jgi:hypothetical protein
MTVLLFGGIADGSVGGLAQIGWAGFALIFAAVQVTNGHDEVNAEAMKPEACSRR